MTIYLAGPISGCSYGECTDWRDFVTGQLEPDGIQCLSPLRGKEYLRSEKVIDGSYPQQVLSCDRGIMTRDYFDCTRADAVLFNLLGATQKVSIGTMMELAWAYQKQIPAIFCIEPTGNIHDHPMTREAMGFRVDNLPAAIHVARMVLWPDERAQADRALKHAIENAGKIRAAACYAAKESPLGPQAGSNS